MIVPWMWICPSFEGGEAWAGAAIPQVIRVVPIAAAIVRAFKFIGSRFSVLVRVSVVNYLHCDHGWSGPDCSRMRQRSSRFALRSYLERCGSVRLFAALKWNSGFSEGIAPWMLWVAISGDVNGCRDFRPLWYWVDFDGPGFRCGVGTADCLSGRVKLLAIQGDRPTGGGEQSRAGTVDHPPGSPLRGSARFNRSAAEVSPPGVSLPRPGPACPGYVSCASGTHDPL